MTKKYLVGIKFNTKTEIYSFNKETDRKAFINDILKTRIIKPQDIATAETNFKRCKND